MAPQWRDQVPSLPPFLVTLETPAGPFRPYWQQAITGLETQVKLMYLSYGDVFTVKLAFWRGILCSLRLYQAQNWECIQRPRKQIGINVFLANTQDSTSEESMKKIPHFLALYTFLYICKHENNAL